jgi:hypothetical protein
MSSPSAPTALVSGTLLWITWLAPIRAVILAWLWFSFAWRGWAPIDLENQNLLSETKQV